jgi:hypothetical protein
LEEVSAKYKKLEAQHKTLRQLTSQKFREFDALKKSLLNDLQSRHEKMVDLEVVLDEAREQYESALVQSGWWFCLFCVGDCEILGVEVPGRLGLQKYWSWDWGVALVVWRL